jgi:hypothetical protein
MNDNAFVFVVCGEKEHINTLNFSVRALKRFSGKKIIVITDKSRNKAEIEHDNVIDVTTRKDFTNHQASIFLKTSLHKIIESGNNYCYLDSDVIALSPGVNEIFNHSYGPITFAADHCRMNFFSPYALHCGCSEKKEKIKKDFTDTLRKIIPDYHQEEISDEKVRKLVRTIKNISENPYYNTRINIIDFLFKYFLNNKDTGAKWGDDFRYSKRKNGWIDLDGNLIMHNLTPYAKKIEETGNFSYCKKKKEWTDKYKENIFSKECNHLCEKILTKFNIKVAQKDFQHWNGGVFLFNEKSADFLETWHQLTMDIFNDSEWQTRDQGTLIATVWKFNLQNQLLLPTEFNFIADFFNPFISFDHNNGFTKDNFKTIIKPKFIHIYHNFGNKNWDVWQGVESIHNNKLK